MVDSRVGSGRQRLTAGLVFSAMVLAALSQGSAGAQVSEVTGSAFGYHADITLFDQEQPEAGPEPQVTLPAAGGNETATAPSAEVVFGPATIFTSGPLDVTTEGTTGPTGSVTSTTTIQNINTSGQEVFTADDVSSTCTASESGVSGSTTITNGTILTHAQAEDHSEGVVDVPTNPEPGHTVEGHLHIGASQDNFRYVFNEQVENDDGSLTVNAVHAYFLGPTATGELVIGQSRCGVNPVQGTITTNVGETTTTAGQTTTTASTRPKAPAASPTPAQPRFTG